MNIRLTLLAILSASALFTFTSASLAAVDDSSPAKSIDGYRFEFPCKDPMPENPKEGADGASALVTGDPKTTDNFTATKTFGGEKGKRYKVTLRFRGVVEPMMCGNASQAWRPSSDTRSPPISCSAIPGMTSSWLTGPRARVIAAPTST